MKKAILILCGFSALVFTAPSHSDRSGSVSELYEFSKTRYLPETTVRALPDPRPEGPHFRINMKREGGGETFTFSCPVDHETGLPEDHPKAFFSGGTGTLIGFSCIGETVGLKASDPRSKECLEKLNRFASSGDPKAQFNLAYLYSKDDSSLIPPDIVPQDFPKAFALAEQAADQNWYPAMNLLSRLFMESAPETENHHKAIYWAKRATDQINEKDFRPNWKAETFLVRMLYLRPLCMLRMSDLQGQNPLQEILTKAKL